MAHPKLSALLVAFGSAASASASPLELHAVDELPESVGQVAARPDGGAYLIGHTNRAGSFEPVVARISPDGAIAFEEAPPVGIMKELVVAEADWALGSNGVAVRESGGEWRVLASFGSGDRSAFLQLAVFEKTRGLVVLDMGGDDSVARFVDTAGSDVRVELPGLRLSVAGDARGVWALVRTRDGYLGYARYADGAWTLWRPDTSPPADPAAAKSLSTFRLATTVPHERLVHLVSDGQGGAFAASAQSLYRIAPDGALARFPQAVPIDGLGWDPALQQVHLYSRTHDGTRPLRVTRVSREGHPIAVDTLGAPPDFVNDSGTSNVSVSVISAAVGGGRTRISIGALVYSFDRGTWSGYYSGRMVRRNREAYARQQRMEQEVERAESRQGRAGAVVGPIALLGTTVGSAFAIRAMGRETARGSAFEIFGGAAGAFFPLLLIDAARELESDNSEGRTNLGVVVGGLGGALLGGLGTWSAGEAIDGSQSRGKAFGGAVAGSLAGTLVTIKLLDVLRDLHIGPGMRFAIAASLSGTAATIGYQLAGGGSSPAH